jgi:hypothetical protein
MKKLAFSLILVMGFCFGYTDIFSQQAQDLSVGRATLAKVDGFPRSKDFVISGIEQKLPVLYHELAQHPADEMITKTKMVETELYKAMLSDLRSSGKSVRQAYDDNIVIFIANYPQFDTWFDKKKSIIAEFNQIVFLN